MPGSVSSITSARTWSPAATAIATWIGEELRTVGLEGEARWRGQALGHADDVALVLGVYGWNDPAGVLVAERGFALHDRQTAAFGQLSYPGSMDYGARSPLELFHEIDDRPGYYAGVAWRHREMLEVRALHYDNRGDPTALDQVFAWDTHFDVVGLRLEPDAHRISARYDRFRTQQQHGYGIPAYDDDGNAATIAYLCDLGEHWQVAAEWLRIRSTFGEREELGLPPTINETQTQLVLRYRIRLQR